MLPRRTPTNISDSRDPLRPKWYVLPSRFSFAGYDVHSLGMAVVPSSAQLDQFCRRDRIQGLRLFSPCRLLVLHIHVCSYPTSCLDLRWIDPSVWRWDGDLAYDGAGTTRACVWEQRSVRTYLYTIGLALNYSCPVTAFLQTSLRASVSL